VQRNRLKRRLREIARTELLPRLARGGCEVDVLVRARPEAYDASFDELSHQLIEVGGWVCSSGG
jgi:ribonuclease P protein component